ncbi:MAG: branched-chain amino acid ABC transporter permease [Deltaproteobacteria bacterium]|nr:branched-chain amino acid ABC transporter permease [Deltaproteobacteria bacterium]
MMRDRSQWTKIVLLALLVGFLVFPLTVEVEESYTITFLFQAFLFIAISQGWNLVAGYAGQISLGQHAFLGVGAYATGIAWMAGWVGFLDPVAFFLSAMAPAFLAVLVGIPLLSKLRGDYFSLGTLGLGEIMKVIFTQGGTITGGATGLLLPSSSYSSMTPYYYLALLLAVGSTLVTWLLVRSRIGLAWVCIRDEEQAANACGIALLRYKIIALAVGAGMAGLAGSLYAYNTFQIMPDDVFGLQWALMPVLMTIAGGVGTLSGPVVGSLVLAGIFQLTGLYLPKIHPLFSGGFIIILALCLPNGVMSILRQRGRSMD